MPRRQWIVTLVNVCNYMTGLFKVQAGRMTSSGPIRARVTGVLTPTSTSVKVDGGWRVTGRWYYNSGSWHSSWAVLGVPVTDAAGEVVDQGLVLIPRTDLEIEDGWFVAGMRGTASNCLIAENVFVPEYRLLSVPAAIGGEFATERKDEALYRSAFIPVLSLVLAGPQLGLGRAALNYVVERAGKKPISYTFYETQSASVGVQLQIAEAAQKIDTARLHAERAAADIDLARCGRDLSRRAHPNPRSRRHRLGRAQHARGDRHPARRARCGVLRRGQPAPTDLARRQRGSTATPSPPPGIAMEVYGKALLDVDETVPPLI